MIKVLVSFLIIFLAVSCTHRQGKPTSGAITEKPKNLTSAKPVVKLPPPRKSALSGKKKNQVFWRLIGMDSISIVVQSVGKTTVTKTISLNQKTFYHSLPAGDWQIQSFKLNGKKYRAINTQRANFKVFENSYSYAGALVIHCPKVGSESFEDLKLMKFFNRYSFASGKSLCEMVVGNDYDLVKGAWSSPTKGKTSKLLLGI